MKILNTLQVSIDESEAIDILLSGNTLPTITSENNDWIEMFNHYSNSFGFDEIIQYDPVYKSKDQYIDSCINTWYIPEEYANVDIETLVYNRCNTDAERDRVQMEFVLYKERNLLPLLCFLNYFIDTLRKNSVLWGVGRGSSVSSYILYLLGVHRINSIKYNLDIGEFLK